MPQQLPKPRIPTTATLDATFWPRALGAPLVILTDFDETISEQDIGALIWERLTPPTPDLIARLSRDEVGSQQAYLETTAWVNPAEGAAIADTVAIDPSFPAFAEWAADREIPLAVVSDGFTFYIDPVLKREGLAHLPVFSNEWVAPGQIDWPYANPACDWCGCCKAAIARRLQLAGSRVIYFGDGTSDLYAVGFADYVFARGRLARYLSQHNAPFFALETFAKAQALLTEHFEAFVDGTMERRNTLGPNERCKF